MDSPELSPAAATLVENGKPLHDQFGEYFVRGISTGGRFFGVVRIDTKSEESKTAVDAELSASYGLTVDADVKLKIRDTLRRANARFEAFTIHDGGRVTTRPTSNDPEVLLDQLYTAMDEWTDTVRDEPKAYSVSLTPYIIALGPPPPNIFEIEHQRDVLIRCAKLRSQTMDKLNLIDYILDPRHMDEFEIIPPPEGPDLPALQGALAGDLDVIADAASFAINKIKEARDPVTFMREIKGVPDFKFTALPTNLPKHTGPALIPVQSFFGRKFLDWKFARDTDSRTVEELRANALNKGHQFAHPNITPEGGPRLGELGGLTQERLNFLFSGVKFKLVFSGSHGEHNAFIGPQVPESGMVSPDSEVTLTIFT
jgi:hypothetical protein